MPKNFLNYASYKYELNCCLPFHFFFFILFLMFTIVYVLCVYATRVKPNPLYLLFSLCIFVNFIFIFSFNSFIMSHWIE